MKRVILKTLVFLVAFVSAVLVISKIMNRDNNSLTKEMNPPTLPIVRIQTGELQYNELHGVLGETDIAFQRDTITVLGENRKLKFCVELYDAQIEKLAIQVRSCDGKRLIENTEITDYTVAKHVMQVDTSVKDLIDSGKEYALIIVLTDKSEREIRYYTRIIWQDGLNVTEKLAFVKDFHEKTFHSEEINTLAKYMECNAQGNNTTLHKVNIHSSLSQLGWGDLNVWPENEPTLNLKDIAEQTGAIELNRIVSTGAGKNKDYYLVEEVYRIRYTTDRVYLLNFDRTMTQIPQVKNDIYANNKIYLGIVSEETPLRESEDGNIVVFEVANRLCSYNITTNKLALLFTYYDEKHMDARSIYQEHAIKILDVSEAGDVQFAVYGYMNRGRHEGETGIQLYSFDSSKNTVEESLYIPYDKTFEILEAEIQNLLYWNREGTLYLYINNTIYEVDAMEKTAQKLAVLEGDGSMEISSDHQVIVWKMDNGLKMMNLSRGNQVNIKGGNGEQLYALGFMDKDLIYGIAKKQDIAMDSGGRMVIPMYKVCICDNKGKILKEYAQENIYITGCAIEGNQISLERVERKQDGNFKEITPEHIMNNEKQEKGKNQLVVAAIDVYERIVQVEVRSTIDHKNIQILTPKEVVFEGNRNVNLDTEKFPEQYYVYDRFGVAGVFRNPAKAFRQAYENAGVVMDEQGNTIWIKGNRVPKNQIMAIKEQVPAKDRNGLAVCLEVMLKYKGITLETEQLLADGENVIGILRDYLQDVRVLDLQGCNLDTILYFTNRDIPVLAVLENGEAVLITGFNQYNIVILDPKTGKLSKKGINDSTKWFENNGNRFITYYPIEK